METGTIIPTVGPSGIGNLQRIRPTSNAGQQKRQISQRRKQKKNVQVPPELIYTPDGQIEADDQGLRVDISA